MTNGKEVLSLPAATGIEPFQDTGSEEDHMMKKKAKEENVEMDFDLDKYPVREFTYQFPYFKDIIAFNPLVSIFGVVVLWGIAIWSMGE